MPDKKPKSDDYPTCIKCGHEPCEGCVTWCDRVLRNIYCPKCDEVVRLWDEDKDGAEISCACGHAFPLDWDEHVEPDLCCEGECQWDWPEDKVHEWCDRMLNQGTVTKPSRYTH